MPGLDPGIHPVRQNLLSEVVAPGTSAWTTGSSPVVTAVVVAPLVTLLPRDKPGPAV
jgi:hypothetical protein